MKKVSTISANKILRLLHFLLLCILILVVWVILSLPLIFYHKPVISASTINFTAAENGIGQDVNDTEDPLPVDGGNGDSIHCQEGFFKENNTKCLPNCKTWSLYERVDAITVDALIVLSATIATLVSITAILLSCLCHRRALEFPAILIVYTLINTTVLGVTVIISYTDRSNLHCSSKNIFESLARPTAFCVFLGISTTYSVVQVTLWWLFHIIMLFFKLMYPLHEISIGKSVKIKYLHISFVSVGLVFPCLPIIATIVDFAIDLQSSSDNEVNVLTGGLGFGSNNFPPIFCVIKDPSVFFFFYILPIDIMTAIGSTLLLIIIWSLHRRHIVQRKTKNSNTKLIGKPEIKLFIVFVYYIVLVALSLCSLTLTSRNFEALREALLRYFSCEHDGHDPNSPCNREDYEKLLHPYSSTLSYFCVSLFPVFNLIYIVNLKEIRSTTTRWIKGRRKKGTLHDIDLKYRKTINNCQS